MADVASRLNVNAVNSRRNLHLQEMSFRNDSTEDKLCLVANTLIYYMIVRPI